MTEKQKDEPGKHPAYKEDIALLRSQHFTINEAKKLGRRSKSIGNPNSLHPFFKG
ncbi:MAG: hypothetical protein HON14_09680 [Rhodospirillaceae bacterium]|jgi:hypothetical protein|nr:hypothetical protein [Rhodospirillaceae bacterium]MBT4588534.1 hypothetical protein [Rhodospirillaceae bacterium]MBT4939390.1 hypothetical protein [Rhodospirillaceae bacterium]MBT5939560.1 hypothetical protein [Rhodospirillaceae bacterium]MBT7265948.1 hypothetical protein [Rhodospirillaceae bacterium]